MVTEGLKGDALRDSGNSTIINKHSIYSVLNEQSTYEGEVKKSSFTKQSSITAVCQEWI